MNIDKFNNRHSGKHIIIVADGLSCPQIEKHPDNIIIAVNHAYKNVIGRPDYLVFNDSHWLYEFKQSEQRPLNEIAGIVFHGFNAKPGTFENVVMFKPGTRLCPKMSDGIYGIWSSGISALTFALMMGAKSVDLYGFDYRLFTDDEAKEYFGKPGRSHASDSMHREMKDRHLINKIKYFEMFTNRNIKIVNRSIHSNIPYFERKL